MDDVLQVNIEDLVVINPGAIRASTGRHQHQCCKFGRRMKTYI